MDRPEKSPLVSVMVPGRNEEQNFADCLHSLLAQGSVIEITVDIIVTDDSSEEKTAAIATQIASAQPHGKHVTLVSVPSLPEGWTKNLFLLYHGDSVAIWRTAAALLCRRLLPPKGFE